MAKKFISFLGTGNYQPCTYTLREECGREVVYIQDDLIDRFCGDYDENDKIVFFLTEEAKKKHWEGEGKLEEIITKKNLKCKTDPVDIKDSKAESDIWELFQQIYENIDDNDEIIFDLTHSYRYLPMLFFSILHYASFIKKISVKGIYYGAYDVIRGTESTIAPIFDLTDSFKIMEWANAADAFVSYGFADKLENCVKKSAKDYHGSAKLAKNISIITEDIMCSRIPKIAEGNIFGYVKKEIGELKGKLQPAFTPILEKVSEKIAKFQSQDTLNFIPAVQWCIDHWMVPQGATILQEGLLTYIISRHDSSKLYEKTLRTIVNGRLNSTGKEFKPDPKEDEYKGLLEKIFEDKFTVACFSICQSITQLRNDVNHGGTGGHDSMSSEKLFNRLKKCFEEVEKLCSGNIDE